jgi:hypothetical protein
MHDQPLGAANDVPALRPVLRSGRQESNDFSGASIPWFVVFLTLFTAVHAVVLGQLVP